MIFNSHLYEQCFNLATLFIWMRVFYGKNALPLYQFLKSEKGFEGFNPNHPLTPIIKGMLSRINRNYKNEADIKWNFTKFLIDREGNVVKRFEPTEDMKLIEDNIKELL